MLGEVMTREDYADREEALPPISMVRRKALFEVANKIAATFDEVKDQREHRLLRRMVDLLVRD